MANPKVITPAAALFTIAELRLHLRVDVLAGGTTHPDDALILALADSAKEHAEHFCNRVFGSQTLELALDAFPDGAIELPGGPVSSITSIVYVDTAGADQTLSSTAYTLDDYSSPCWVVPAYGETWPDTLDTANAVKVRYVAGDFPDAVRAGMLLLIGHLYEQRASTSRSEVYSVPLGVDCLLQTAKVYR